MNRLESLISFLAINPNVEATPVAGYPKEFSCRFCGYGSDEHDGTCVYTQAIADLRAVWKIDKTKENADV